MIIISIVKRHGQLVEYGAIFNNYSGAEGEVNIVDYYMAGSANGQDEANPVF